MKFIKKFISTYILTFIALFTFICCSSNSPVDPEDENIPIGDFSLITPGHESTVVYNQPTLTWEEVENPDNINISYEIRLDTKSPPSTVITDGFARDEFTLDHTLEPGTTYYWQVISNLSNGEKFKSKEIYSFTFIEGNGVIANDDLGMPLRYRHSLELFDDKLWMFAGQAGGHSERDIWYSEDAIEWEKAVDIHDFPPRFSHTSLVYDDKIWIIGGTAVGRFFKDVWSTQDGVNWSEITDNAHFGWRNDHSSVVFDNKMWVIGGGVIDQEEHTGEIVNDVWFSTDGKDWTQATDSADFQPRLNHVSVVFDNKIWVIGGSGSNNNLKDVWYSENGVDWTLATDDIGIGDISSYKSVVYDGKIWLIGGTPEGGGASGEIWYSSDGTNWSKAPPFFGRVGHALTVFQDKIWGVGGASQDSGPSDVNDSWYLNLP